MKWVTRKQIRVNRLATAWLISRFIDKEPEFLFVEPEEAAHYESQGYLGFDAPGCKFSHETGITSFQLLVDEYKIVDPAVLEIANIINAADRPGKSHLHPAAKGIQLISHGIPLVTQDDHESLQKGFFIYDTIYANLSKALPSGHPALQTSEPEMLSYTPEELGASVTYYTVVSAVVPRPIGWLTTSPAEESTGFATTNLAPFSFFNAVSGDPPYVMVSIASRDGKTEKDTLRNIKATGEFVCNIVDGSLVELCNLSAKEFPADQSEAAALGIELAPSVDVRPPRVSRARVALECKSFDIIPLPSSEYTMVLARIVRFHIQSSLYDRSSGLIDAAALDPAARLGGPKYGRIGEQLSFPRLYQNYFRTNNNNPSTSSQ